MVRTMPKPFYFLSLHLVAEPWKASPILRGSGFGLPVLSGLLDRGNDVLKGSNHGYRQHAEDRQPNDPICDRHDMLSFPPLGLSIETAGPACTLFFRRTTIITEPTAIFNRAAPMGNETAVIHRQNCCIRELTSKIRRFIDWANASIIWKPARSETRQTPISCHPV
jgi:hypothetical protein